jgi:ABC-type proline/glycine betaine transport system substrate-binding protein
MNGVTLREETLGRTSANARRTTGNQHDILVVCWHSHWLSV